jgi:hypothetical protein
MQEKNKRINLPTSYTGLANTRHKTIAAVIFHMTDLVKLISFLHLILGAEILLHFAGVNDYFADVNDHFADVNDHFADVNDYFAGVNGYFVPVNGHFVPVNVTFWQKKILHIVVNG